MKLLASLLTLFFVVATFASETTEFPTTLVPSGKFKQGDPIPDKGFKDKADVADWALSTSTWGSAHEVRQGKTNVYYSWRTFGSGHIAEEIIFYTKSYNDRLRPFLKIPTQYREFRVDVENDNIVVRAYSKEKKSFEVALTITPEMLPSAR